MISYKKRDLSLKLGSGEGKTSRQIKKFIVKLRMWYADAKGHHGKRWNYEPSEHYLGNKKKHDR